MSSEDEFPLPYGWVREFDPNTGHPFWVDTTVDPARAIWTHPYEDEEYLREHPDVREKVGNVARQRSSKEDPKPTRRHSFNGHDSATMAPDDDLALPDSSKKGKNKRGFLGKLKDKAIGTKEERAAMKREQARIDGERRQRRNEMIRAQQARYAQQQAQQQALYNQQRQQQLQFAGPSQQRYGPPPGDPYMYGPEYGSGYGYGYGYNDYDGYSRRRRHGNSMGGMGGGGALPLLGALAGGLLLGDILGGF